MAAKKTKVRRGLKVEVKRAFNDSIYMLGCGDPSLIEPETKRLRAVCREVLDLLKEV